MDPGGGATSEWHLVTTLATDNGFWGWNLANSEQYNSTKQKFWFEFTEAKHDNNLEGTGFNISLNLDEIY